MTGCADSELRVWEIIYKDDGVDSNDMKRKSTAQSDPDPEEAEVKKKFTLFDNIFVVVDRLNLHCM